jgi:EAL domain-containing protein (putative c-di-GMP-specific phosphodiesterase class I)
MNPKKQLSEAIQNAKEPVIVLMRLEDFSTLEEFYDNQTVENIQVRITSFLEKNLPEACNIDKIYQLGNGEYAMTNERSVCMKNKDNFISILKEFQEKIKNSTIDIEDLDYDMSIIISLAYEDDKVLESSRLGIRELLKTKQDFIVSNNLAQIEHEKAQKNMKTIEMIKKAIQDLKIVSYFQPIVNNKTEKIEKYESLVRLIDQEGKVLSPFFFLDVSKKGKYYSQITNMVLISSFNALKDTDMDISINISALDIEQKSTRERIFNLLMDNKQYASRVVFELLEDESVKDFKTIREFISDVKKLGVKIAIDDFGAGYSNFERLLDYQPDILKIDGCLVRDIETNSYSLSVVKTIVSFAKEQNIQTIAEFIENEAIFNILKSLGVDYSQGYYFGKPEPLQ